MRIARTPAILILIALTLALPAAALGAPNGSGTIAATAKKQLLAAKLEACTADASGPYATFTGTMPSAGLRGGRMEMRFELYRRAPGTPGWAKVPKVPSFGTWDQSDPGVSGFIVKKRVGGLEPGTRYRAVVRYRWRNARGRVARSAHRVTAACRPPDTRADLVLRDPSASRGATAGTAVYRIVVRNAGGGDAGPFAVGLEVDGVAQPPQAVASLASHARTVVTFQAPTCTPGSTLRFTADAGAAVAESDEADNVVQGSCPARLGG